MADIPGFLKESIDRTKAEYKRLGRSGLQVSVPILGAMCFDSRGLLRKSRLVMIREGMKGSFADNIGSWLFHC